jgi:putative NADH-flavin reductase
LQERPDNHAHHRLRSRRNHRKPVDSAGRSTISSEDFAVALLDEVERPRHRRARFTVARTLPTDR